MSHPCSLSKRQLIAFQSVNCLLSKELRVITLQKRVIVVANNPSTVANDLIADGDVRRHSCRPTCQCPWLSSTTVGNEAIGDGVIGDDGSPAMIY